MNSEATATTVLRDDLEAALGDLADEVTVGRERRLFVTLADAGDLVPAMETLRDEGITHLSTITGLDDGEQYELLYHMLRYGEYDDGDLGEATSVTVRLFLDRDDPTLASLVGTIPGASMYEREVMDMLGVEFEGHPKPERLLLADDWEAGPPLRKPDAVQEEADDAGNGEEAEEEAEETATEEEAEAEEEGKESASEGEMKESASEREMKETEPEVEEEVDDDSADATDDAEGSEADESTGNPDENPDGKADDPGNTGDADGTEDTEP